MQPRRLTDIRSLEPSRRCVPSAFAVRPRPRCLTAQSAAGSSALPSSPPSPQHDVAAFQLKVLRKMLGFMGPAVLIPLGDPLMALGDTVFVGQFAGTTELAAMGPANTVMLFSLHIFQSLSLATLNLIASHLRDGEREEAAQYLGCGLTLAIVMGCLGAAVLSLGSGWLIPATGVRDTALIQPSADYLSIRGLALPAVLLTAVAQSGKLAQRDSLTPCLSVALTVAVSLVANLVFVAWLGWGLKGAAITTVATQYLGAAALLWALHHKSSQLVPNWSLPRPDLLWTYFKTMAPLTVVSLSKNTCYLIVQTTAATLATVALAAHQATFSVWALFTWTLGPVEQATMAYLPTAKELWQRQATSQLVIVMGVLIAMLGGLSLAGLLVGAPGLLVKDTAVQPLVSFIALQAATALCLVGLDVGASSINIALKDYQYVARSYVVTLVATAAYFAVCRQQQWGLGGVWWGLAVFFGMRCVQSMARALWSVQLWPFSGRGGDERAVMAGAGKGVAVSESVVADGVHQSRRSPSPEVALRPPTTAISQQDSSQTSSGATNGTGHVVSTESTDVGEATAAAVEQEVAGLQLLEGTEVLGLQPSLPAGDSVVAHALDGPQASPQHPAQQQVGQHTSTGVQQPGNRSGAQGNQEAGKGSGQDAPG